MREPEKALQPAANPFRGLSVAELSRSAARRPVRGLAQASREID